MPQQTTDVDHSVTRPNTIKHWVLYTLDALEADHETDDGTNEAREQGTYPEDIYEYAAGDDSIIFRNEQEIKSALSEIARMAPFYQLEDRPVDRRTDATDWGGPDVEYRYRLTDFGREALLDLGVPEKRPNRRDADFSRELPGARPAHQPGWWQPDYELFGDEWDIRDHDWVTTDHARIFYKDEADQRMAESRGYTYIPTKLADMDVFDDVTFVVTCGPRRMHDLAFAIRDPWRKVVQIDIYSPMALHRSNEEIKANFEQLTRDLIAALHDVHEKYTDDPTGDAPDELPLDADG